MTKKTVKYRVVRGIESDAEGWRYEPGDVVTEKDIKGAPVEHWLKRGILEVENGDG